MTWKPTCEAEALLTELGLSPADLDHAIAELERTEGIAIQTIAGINEDGVFGSRQAGWRPDLPEAYAALPLGLRPDRCMACSGCAGGTGMVSTLAAGNGSRGRSPRPAALPRPLIGLRD